MRVALALLVAALPVAAAGDGMDDGPMVDVLRLASANSEMDVNGDAVPDRLVLVYNDAGDGVDLISFVSDETGGLGPALVLRSALPAGSPRQNNLHTLGWSNTPEAGVATDPVIWGSNGETSAQIVLRWTGGAWAVMRASRDVQHEDPRKADSCSIYYPNVEEVAWEPLLEQLAPYWWRDASCRG